MYQEKKVKCSATSIDQIPPHYRMFPEKNIIRVKEPGDTVTKECQREIQVNTPANYQKEIQIKKEQPGERRQI